MSVRWVAIIAVGVLTALFIYGCGPQLICVAEGGEPVGNALGVEWCDLDGDRFFTPEGGDWILGW